MSQNRDYSIDNLRIFLTCLVVLHHLSITYGAPGDWYYNESELEGLAVIPMAMFVATNQAFFMGMFFFISAYFIPRSHERKGTAKYLRDRFLRLGIPTIIFFFLLNPLTGFLSLRTSNPDLRFWEKVSAGMGWIWSYVVCRGLTLPDNDLPPTGDRQEFLSD